MTLSNDMSTDFSVLATARGVSLIYSFAPEGHFLAQVNEEAAMLLCPVDRLDEELDARIAAEDALEQTIDV